LGLPPPKGVPLWWDLGISFNEKNSPAPDALFSEANFVVVPIFRDSDEGCCQATVRALINLYGKYLKEHFFEAERSDSWMLLKRPG
jgi:hypothetical protein